MKMIKCPKCGGFRIWRGILPRIIRMSIQKGVAFIEPPYNEAKKLEVRENDLYIYICDDCNNQFEEEC